ncbi:Uncharacterised protein [Sebaldella termitidis]|uniref:Inner membrane component domain-containing protein n=1 Tax=Sebaldella termitidis (strain ATCC 33386 / NCTC 11300) TaxID=526218 RepID=D1AN85_SEBTE|nr:hypothetical protein [Sebaldella termitidis]ACZ09689.1 hypothetical protein Sterm_2845 [Sebaldella termitidis ATCC 33386]SUI25021.1 Uncharacterised protein [Sebaldella termitidis]
MVIEGIKMIFIAILFCIGLFWCGILFIGIISLMCHIFIGIPIKILEALFPEKPKVPSSPKPKKIPGSK